MKKLLRSMLTFAIALAMMMFVSAGLQAETQAAQKPTFWDTESLQFMFTPEWKGLELQPNGLTKKAKVTVSSSNEKVAQVTWNKETKTASVQAKKPGTANITIKIKQGGKTYKKVTRMTWTKYNNPVKTIKIGNTKYPAKYFNKNTAVSMKKMSGKKKVYVKLKEGYTITGMYFDRGGVSKAIKNGDKIIFNQKGKEVTCLSICYKDPKGKEGILSISADNRNYTHGI